MKKSFIFTLLFISSFAVSAAAQTATPAKPRIVSKGVVNGAAVSLPKPAYPPAAQAVRASGAVEVQVTIDEAGNVISATASSGHPLLQQAAVEAARQAKFKPTTLQGQPVKATGRIVYNFVPAEPAKDEEVQPWVFGFLLSFLENADPEVIKLIGDAKEFEAIFTEMGTELSKEIPEEIAAEKNLIEKFTKAKGDERRAVAGELNRALKKYFTPSELWFVEIGDSLGLLTIEMLKQVKNLQAGLAVEDGSMKTHLEKIKMALAAKPTDIPDQQVKLFKPIAELAAQDLKTGDNLIKLSESISPLFESLPD